MLDQEAYNELSLYTLSLGDPAFIHQHIVDAYGAQHADKNSKPVTIYFALMGLYLYLEKNYTGKEVQLAHMKVAKIRRDWPSFSILKNQGKIMVSDVLEAPAGKARDEMIKKWCISVWETHKESQEKVRRHVEMDLDLKN